MIAYEDTLASLQHTISKFHNINFKVGISIEWHSDYIKQVKSFYSFIST